MEAPREDLYRARSEAPEFRAETPGDGFIGTIDGHFAVFNQWTEINSAYEGRFMERVSPGAFTKTIKEARRAMRVLFDHGKDPQIGNKILGPIDTLEETDEGARYVTPLYDTSYNRDLAPGLRDRGYGASFRFRAIKEQWVDRPERSPWNPEGLPERTLFEVATPEFGPVTFPAYAGASSGMRSATDYFRAYPGAVLLGTHPQEVDPGRAAATDDGAASSHSGMTREARARVLALMS